MKILLTALTAVFFMFAVNGCSDDTDCDAGTPEVGVDVSVELDVSEDVFISVSDVESDTTSTEDDVVNSDTTAVEETELTDTTNDSSDEAADQGESE